MNIMTKQKDKDEKGLSLLKMIFKKKDPLEKKIEPYKPALKTKTEYRVSKDLYEAPLKILPKVHYENEIERVEKTFDKFPYGAILTLEGKRYRVKKHPRLDYSKTYLPLFLLIRNGFLERI